MSEALEYDPSSELVERETRRSHLESLIASVDSRLTHMQPYIDRLMEVRHRLYGGKLPHTLFDVARPTLEQLYDEPTYNDVFVYGYDPRLKITEDDPTAAGDLKARSGPRFHEGESYDDGEYSRVIFDVADQLGFVKKELGHASDPIDEQIGIADGRLEPIGEVEAIVVPGARSYSNVMRMRDALRNLEQGRVETDTLIITTTDRPVDQAERDRVAAVGFRGGETEFESLVLALSDLTQTQIDMSAAQPLPVTLGDATLEGKALGVDITIGDKPLHCIFVCAPYSPERIVGWKDGEPIKADRANTDETFVAALSLLGEGPGKLLIESHDTWAIGQGIVAEQIFGIAGKDIIATGPQKLERVVEKTDTQGNSYLSLSHPEEVVDEIAKTYAFLTQTRIKASTALSRLTI